MLIDLLAGCGLGVLTVFLAVSIGGVWSRRTLDGGNQEPENASENVSAQERPDPSSAGDDNGNDQRVRNNFRAMEAMLQAMIPTIRLRPSSVTPARWNE